MITFFFIVVDWMYELKHKSRDKFGIKESCEETPQAFVIVTSDTKGDDALLTYATNERILPPDVFQEKVTLCDQSMTTASVEQRKYYIRKKQFRKIFKDAFRREYHEENSENEERSGDHDEGSGCSVKMSPKQTMDRILNRGNPATPCMESYEARINSFKNWPLNGENDEKKTAAAGFFYQGINCNAECYFCGFALYIWEDPPDIEHIQWSPRCRFVGSTYSPDYISNILYRRCLSSNSDLQKSNSESLRMVSLKLKRSIQVQEKHELDMHLSTTKLTEDKYQQPDEITEDTLPRIEVTKGRHLSPEKVTEETHLPPIEVTKVKHVPPEEVSEDTHLPPIEVTKVRQLPSEEVTEETHLPPIEVTKVKQLPPDEVTEDTHLTPIEATKVRHLPPNEINEKNYPSTKEATGERNCEDNDRHSEDFFLGIDLKRF